MLGDMKDSTEGEIYFTGHFIPEKPSCSSRTDGPGIDVFGVTPDQVAEGALVRDLLRSCHDSYLVECPDLRAQAAVNAQDFAVDDGC